MKQVQQLIDQCIHEKATMQFQKFIDIKLQDSIGENLWNKVWFHTTKHAKIIDNYLKQKLK